MEAKKKQIQSRIQRDAYLFREIEKTLLEREQTELKCSELARTKNETFFAEEYMKMAYRYRIGAAALAALASTCEDEYRRRAMEDEPQTEPVAASEWEQEEQDTEQAERTEPAANGTGIEEYYVAETVGGGLP